MSPIPRSAVLLMTKTPGRLPIKTRLAPAIGTQNAEALYCCFLADIAAKFRDMNLDLRVHHLPGDADEIPLLEGWLGKSSDYWPQVGQELGARMWQAFKAGFAAGYGQLILIGGDCPDLPPDTFRTAFEALTDHDCVLGPTRDGGYYLLGLRPDGMLHSLFDFPDWSDGSVYAETLSRLTTAHQSYHELAAWNDIDTLADLQSLRQRNATGWFSQSLTMNYLRSLDLAF